MIFNKKDKNKKCEGCGSNIEKSFSYCPHCGNSFIDPRKEEEDFGILGRDDSTGLGLGGEFMPQGFGITDKIFNSMVNSLMKNLDKQFKNQFKDMNGNFGNSEVKAFPNGVRIKVSGPFDAKTKKKARRTQTSVNRAVDEGQVKKMSSLPRAEAKTNVKRVGDKVVYELSTPGVDSPENVFISKLESGYEVKAIGSKKVYVNSVPINLPLKKYSITKNKLLVEFNAGQGE